ncbi:ATP-dependent DNA helicase [Bacillus sp. V33-4]|uniref:ATP-dependent DNA helicase n=1 Tax=Bacillus sp. V33-4 TaxID=2054169 RepID=UPI000C76ED89|nr:ATP-dependent DNA helicase [Bacillus sp. V33-4]PLR82697.1 ATP-dependent helicase [Bacillus sp. V33-4]
MQGRLPFAISKTDSFFNVFNDWIGDVFYDILPEAGFELRDEQIFMAFQLEKAFKEKQVMFAEAGVGTGKTIVYLLYAICYARYQNKPAIIACADETLIEQLVKKEGDIAKLEKALNLNIDVRLAKSRDQYLCLNKLDEVILRNDSGPYGAIFDELPDFVGTGSSMQKFHKYGDRKDYPGISDETWKQVGWDSLQDCFSCSKRHRCGQTLHREFYRGSSDLIICSHDFYMEHIWTQESRKREGQLPLLPESSAVIFDEGHLLEYAAQKALTYRFAEQTLDKLLTRLTANDVRENTLYCIEESLVQNEHFFAVLQAASQITDGSEKQMVIKTPLLLEEGKRLFNLLNQLQEELVFDSEMYVINDYDLKIVEEYLEQITYSLSLFFKETKGINWFEENKGERTLVIMPRMVEEIMREEVFAQKKPFIFSSATLSDNKSFDYIATSLGIDTFLSFSVESPFDYGENMKIYIPGFAKDDRQKRLEYTLNQLQQSDGRGLVLFTNEDDLNRFREYAAEKTGFPIYFEGDAEISALVSKFQNNEQSVLCSVHMWEGLDIPGRALENVIIYSLPYPPNDPVFSAKREESKDPFHDVDLPYMLLRLRQGIGRLIRTHEDKGSVHILINKEEPAHVTELIKNALPTKVTQ